MAKNQGIKFEGINEFYKILDNVPREIKEKGELSAQHKAMKPIETKARGYLKQYARGTDMDGFSKLRLLAETVRRVRYRGGVNVQIKNVIDIPVKGLKQRSEFTAFGWARLIAQGRQWTAKSSGSRRRYNTGTTEGKGDFIEKAFHKEGRTALNTYNNIKVLMVKKAWERSIRKYGVRG
jgi:hypothetical protein